MSNPTKFGVTQAAELAGTTRQTIHRFIKTGKLSAEKTPDGKTVIDMSELLRIFPNLVMPGTSRISRPDTLEVTAVLQSQIEMLQRELDVIRQERQRKDEEYREERNRLLGIIERQTPLLPKASDQELKPRWWRRLFR